MVSTSCSSRHRAVSFITGFAVFMQRYLWIPIVNVIMSYFPALRFITITYLNNFHGQAQAHIIRSRITVTYFNFHGQRKLIYYTFSVLFFHRAVVCRVVGVLMMTTRRQSIQSRLSCDYKFGYLWPVGSYCSLLGLKAKSRRRNCF